MTGVRPTALAYVCGPDPALTLQREAVARHAAAEGLAIERFIDDRRDGLTISQLVTDALACGVSVVLVPGGVHMAKAHARVTRDLEPHGAVCVVVGPTTARQCLGRLATDPPRQRQEGAGVSTPQLLDVT